MNVRKAIEISSAATVLAVLVTGCGTEGPEKPIAIGSPPDTPEPKEVLEDDIFETENHRILSEWLISNSEISSSIGINVSNELLLEIEEQELIAILEGMKQYLNRFDYINDGLYIGLTDPSHISPDGRFLEYSDNSSIRYNLDEHRFDSSGNLSTDGIAMKFKNTTSHSFTHANRSEITYLDEKFVVTDNGDKVIGYNGFTIVMEMADGTILHYTDVEEALAEAIATEVNPEYVPASEDYYIIGQLMYSIIREYSDIDTIEGIAKDNDFFN